MYRPVPVYREVLNTVVNRVPVPVPVRKLFPLPVPVAVPKPVPVGVPFAVPKPVPVQNHHVLIRKIGVPVSLAAGYGGVKKLYG